MTPMISLVVPVFNVEKYLDRCMQSIFAQTYDNFEVILVDDGSTDESGKMCDSYTKTDGRVIAFHKPNGGLSDARNYGVEHSKADLVTFIDSDDCVTEDYLEYLWCLMRKYDSDISCAGFQQVPEGKDFSLKKDATSEVRLSTEQALERICCTSVSAVGKLYKKELLLKHRFPVNRLYEDIATTYKLMSECKTVAFSDKEIYVWVQREGSITHSKFNEKHLDIFWALDELYDFMHRYYATCIRAASFRYVFDTIYFLSLVFDCCKKVSKRKYFIIARNKAMSHLWPAYKCNTATLKFRMAILCIYLGYLPSVFLFKLRRVHKQLKHYSFLL